MVQNRTAGAARRIGALVLVSIVATACTASAASSPGASAAGTTAPAGSSSAAPSAPAAPSGDLTGCGAGKKVGFVIMNTTLPLFVDMQKSGGEIAKAYGINDVWQSADGSLEKMVSIMEDMIAQKYDVIAVNPINANAMTSVINKATAAGIPVVSMAANVAGSGNINTLYNDYDNFTKQADILGTALDGKGYVLYLYGTIGNYASDQRAKGFKDEMTAKFPNIVLDVQETKNDVTKAATIVQQVLAAHPELSGIASNDGNLNVAAIKVLKDAGKTGVVETANTGLPAMGAYLDSGEVLSDIATGNFRIGAWNAAVAARLACGQTFSNNLYMNSPLIMSDTTAATLKGKGLDLAHISEAAAQTLMAGYLDEYGPKAPATNMTAQP